MDMQKKDGTMTKKTIDNNGFEEWGGYMEAKKSKLAEQFLIDANKANTLKANIFCGTSIFVNGYTVPSADELRVLMMEYGGIYHHYYCKNKTTFTVASNLPAAKMKQLKSVKVIKPEWVVDSIAEGKMLDYHQYLLYSSEPSNQPRVQFDKKMCSTTAKSESFENISSTTGANSIIGISNTESESRHFSHVTKTASNDGFLNEFYSNSRLHHISTMGATFKQYVNELRLNGNNRFEGRERFKKWKNCKADEFSTANEIDFDKEQTIMHIDMDCFFVSVGLRNHPELKGVPVAVTHAKGNKVMKREGMDRQAEFNFYYNRPKETLKYKSHLASTNVDDLAERESSSKWFIGIGDHDSMAEVSSCSYEARKLGIRNGMLLGQALKLCPNLKMIPYDFEGYKEVSYMLYDYIASFTLDIEAVSCDEMYVDCSEVLSSVMATPIEFASFLRREILEITGCPCSTGFGSNRLLARLATKRAKPNGQFHIKQEDVNQFIQEFDVSDLPGVGHSISSKLSLMGVATCKELQNVSLSKLQLEFGHKIGMTLHKNSRGEDDRVLNFSHQRKSVSADVNYGIRFQNVTEAENFLKKLAEEVENRLNNVSMKGRCITLKLMTKAKDAPAESSKFMGHGACNYFTKSVSLPMPTSEATVILREVLKIVRNNISVDVKDMRGIGIQVSRLESKCTPGKSMSLDKFLSAKNITTQSTENGPLKPRISIPVKKVEIKKDKNQSSKSTSLGVNKGPLDMFLNNYKRDSNKMESKSKLDQSFLNALPDDIRQEILNEDSRSSSNFSLSLDENSTDSATNENIYPSQIDQTFLEALPLDIRQELEADIKRTMASNTPSINEQNTNSLSQYINSDGKMLKLNSGIPLAEMKSLIQEWISQVDIPEKCDTNMLSDYLQQSVFKRKLESVEVLLCLLHRLITKKNCIIWQETYYDVAAKVQEAMKIAYGSSLLINKDFDTSY